MDRNIAVIGAGYWGKNLVRNFAGLGALHTICDSNPQVLKQFEMTYPDVSREISLQPVLASNEVTGVVISSPVAYHYSMTREALLADKDVFVEKPLALRVEEGEELVRLAEERDKILMVGHLLEYHPAVVKLKELVDGGKLGKIQYIYSNRLNLGKFRTEENIMWSFAPHDISIILLLLNEMPQDVSAHGGRYLHQDIADVTITTMSYLGKSMKICYIADAMSIHTQRWVKYFANRGNEVHLISPTPAGGSDIGRAKLHVLKRFPLNMRVVSFAINLLLYAIQIRKLLRKIKPDILHAHYITDCGFWGALSGFHPFMLSVWGSDVLVDPNKSSIHRSFVRFALKRADLITTTAQYVNQYLQQEFNLPSNKVKTILWGIDINTFQKRCPDEGKTLRKKLIIDDGCFTIISPRSMKEPYGIESIVKSIPHIIEKHPNTCFILLAGLAEPAYRDRLKDMVENLDIKEHVRFVPRYLDQREMAAYYNISEVFISIPRTDQFAACIMEGMSCGVVPIVGKLEVYRQYLIDGENALFVDRQNPRDIAEKVIYCIEHPELKDRFYKINGKIIIEEGNWNKNTLRIEKVYLDLLKGNQQR